MVAMTGVLAQLMWPSMDSGLPEVSMLKADGAASKVIPMPTLDANWVASNIMPMPTLAAEEVTSKIMPI